MAKPKDKAFTADYINVDLEVRSRTNLKPLVDALSQLSLYVGGSKGDFLATFENRAAAVHAPDLAILRLVRAIDTLSPEIKRHWTKARDRVFHIGLAKAGGSKVFQLSLSTATVAAIVRLKARIALSFYPPYYP